MTTIEENQIDQRDEKPFKFKTFSTRKTTKTGMSLFTLSTQLIEATKIYQLRTLGIATEPSPSPGRSDDFVLIHGEVELDEVESKWRDDFYGGVPPQLIEKALALWGSET